MASGFGVEKEDSVRTPQLTPYHLCLALQCSFFYLLDKEVPLVFRCPSILSPDDTRGPVQVEHVYQMLFLILQLLDLGLQLGIHTLQFLRLLRDNQQRHALWREPRSREVGDYLETFGLLKLRETC